MPSVTGNDASSVHPMIIDQLNAELAGGAGVAALRLHQALRGIGVESRLWCQRLPHEPRPAGAACLTWRRPGDSPVRRILTWLAYAARKARWRIDKWRYLRGRSEKLELFSVPWAFRDTPFDPQVLRGDVLHLHWISRFLDLSSFFATLPRSRPVVWTLHDMSPFTGGCHHSDGCQAFTAGCGNCPQLIYSHARDLSQRGLAVKLAAVANRNVHVVTPSRWLERLVRGSRVFATARSVRTIHNGLDVRQWMPRDRQVARRELGLPAGRLVVAFGAAWIANRRKGFVEYATALSKLADRLPVMGLIFGGGRFPENAPVSFPYRHVGYVSGPERQSLVYSAADVFVLSSLGENLAQSGVEAMSCGTPVASFDVGGLSEYVIPAETGMLARAGDPDDLARQIRWLLEHPEQRLRMGAAGRELVEREFDHVKQAGKYLALYESVAPRGAARAA